MSSTNHKTNFSESSRATTMQRTRLVAVYVVATMLLMGLAGYALFYQFQSTDQLLKKGLVASARGDFAAAKQYGDRILQSDPNNRSALVLMSRITFNQQEYEEAIKFCDRIPDDGSQDAIYARCHAGDIFLMHKYQLSKAEEQFRRALNQNENSIYANERLAFVLGVGARQWDALPFRLALIRFNEFSMLELRLICKGRSILENEIEIPKYREGDPDDPAAQLAQARIEILKHEKVNEPQEMLRAIVQKHPRLIEAQTLLGRLLFEHASEEEFLKWHSAIPRVADNYPEIWELRGSHAVRSNEIETAIRCFWEAVRRDPNDPGTIYQLGRLLNSAENKNDATPFLKRARQLENYSNIVKVAETGQDVAKIRNASESAESLGLLFEAYAWAKLTLQHGLHLKWASKTIERLKPRLAHLPLTRAIPDENPALQIDLSEYPLPSWPSTDGSNILENVASASQTFTTFEDQAVSVGIDFTYFNGGEPTTTGIIKMYETLGGGVAILDYDVDGWPDVYLTQGCTWPPNEKQDKLLDRLYRNLGDGRFADVTTEAGLAENRFSQGATVGDYNNDGFPDLYVANIGGNRLFQNNGDGTFSEAADVFDTNSWRWSSSCVMADLNGDTLPDIFVDNFLTGKDVFSRVCKNSLGNPTTCLPQHFTGSQNQLYLNLGDGRFKEITASAGIEVPEPGKSLGIVAADFDGTNRLSLFIANDVGPNFFFVNQTSLENHQPGFLEQSLLLGLSLNRLGRSEACMGVAAGDSNQNGRIDLFATNFLKETNTLYIQSEDGLYSDVTHNVGLAKPSVPTLGFGTQFIDSELDGDLDLIVTNGHVNDVRHTENAYKMPPQYFQNVGDGQFVDVSKNGLGKYFDGEYLGRGMARVDWNRDGKDDIVISHLDVPVALLTNTTKKTGNFLTVELRAVSSARDAIGSTVTVKSGGRTYVKQLMAGDGFFASNERKLVFGLGTNTTIDSLEIRWPSGVLQSFSNPPVNSQLLILEEKPSYFMRRKAAVGPEFPAQNL